MTLHDLAVELHKMVSDLSLSYPYLKFGYIFHAEFGDCTPSEIIAEAIRLFPKSNIKESFDTEINKGRSIGDFSKSSACAAIKAAAGIK